MAVVFRVKTCSTIRRCISTGLCFNARGGKVKGKKVEEVVDDTPAVDPYECLNHSVCLGANVLKTGEDPPLKSDSEYPDWLWTLTDSNTDSTDKIYWRQQNKKKSRLRNKEMQLNEY